MLSKIRTKNGTQHMFESLSFVHFSAEERFIINEHDPDVNFYNDVFDLDAQCLAPDKFQRNFMPF